MKCTSCTRISKKYQDTSNRLVKKKKRGEELFKMAGCESVWRMTQFLVCLVVGWRTLLRSMFTKTVSRNNCTSNECWLNSMSLLYFTWKIYQNKRHFSNTYGIHWPTGRSQRPRGLRRGSAAARLLGLRVRIPPGHGCLSLVSIVYYQVEVPALSWSLVGRSPTECGVSVIV